MGTPLWGLVGKTIEVTHFRQLFGVGVAWRRALARPCVLLGVVGDALEAVVHRAPRRWAMIAPGVADIAA